jgi:hypothetical protein
MQLVPLHPGPGLDAAHVPVVHRPDHRRRRRHGGAVHVDSPSSPIAERRLVSNLVPIKWEIGFKVCLSKWNLHRYTTGSHGSSLSHGGFRV